MRRKPKMAENYLDQIPVRGTNRPWTEDESGMVVIDIENKGVANKIAQTFFKKPRVSHISLDKYGTVVWNSIDGENTVGEIVEIMKQHFPDEKDRMLNRVVTFMATLQAHAFVKIK